MRHNMIIDENGKVIPEYLFEVNMMNALHMAELNSQIKAMARNDKNEEIKLKEALLKTIECTSNQGG